MRAVWTASIVALFFAGAVAAGEAKGSTWEDLSRQVASLYQQGQYERAVVVAKEALAVAEKEFGAEHPNVAISLNNLAGLYQDLGLYALAELLYQRALATWEKALGPEHSSVAASLNNLATLYLDQGLYARAEPLLQRALAIWEKALGPEHPQVATSLNNLAKLYRAQGLYAQAAPLLLRALAIREKALGPEHPDVANSLNNLATLYLDQGLYAQAEPLLQRALAIDEKALGPEHPDVATSLNNLAMLYNNQGLYAQAEPLYLRALATSERVLGPEHPLVATSLNNLAMLYYNQGLYAQAEPLYQRALAIDEKALGPEHPQVATSLNNLATLYGDQGLYAQAEPLYLRVLAIQEKALGPEHPQVATSLNNLAKLYQAQGVYAQAEPLYRRARAIKEKALGPEHPLVAASLNNLAALYLDQGLYAQAEPLLQRALAIWEKALRPEHPDVAPSLDGLALLYYNQGLYAQAAPLLLRALAIREKALGPEHPDVANSLNNLATLYLDQGLYARAEPLLQRALAIDEKALGPEHPDVAQSLNNLATLYQAQGLYAQAEPLYQRALAIWEKALGPEHPHVATSLNNLATLYRAQGLYAQAEPLYQRALAILEKALGPEHPDVAASLNNLAWLYCAQDQFSQGASLFSRAAQVFESARLRIGSGLERATFQGSPYGLLAASRLLGKEALTAWPAAERDLGRVLADLLMRGNERQLTVREAAYEDSLRRLLDRLESRLSAQGRAAPAARGDSLASEQSAIRLQHLATQAEWTRFQREMAQKYPVTEGQAFPLEKVQAALGEKAAILGWLDAEVKPDSLMSWAYIVRARGPVQWVRLDADKALAQAPPLASEREAPGLWRLARSRWLGLAEAGVPDSSAIQLAAALSAARIQSVLPLLEGVEDLIVIPAGVMAYIPAETLVDEQGQYLGDRFTISYTPSATIYTWLQEQAAARVSREPGSPSGSGRALLLGDPPFSPAQKTAMALEKGPVLVAAAAGPTDPATLREARAGDREAAARLPRLPGTRAEVTAIAKLTAAPTLLLGPDASEQDLTRLAQSGDLASYRTIHLATHAFSDPDQPERSCLILSQVDLPDAYEAAVKGERIYDGRLTVQEILREWKLDADLVTLSACETALGKQISGEGMVGFAHAFLQVGARSLLVSLWKVDDTATSLLMTRFYENLWQRKMGKAAALREAKQWLRAYVDDTGQRPYEHPYFWSAFVLVGERD